MQDEERLTLSTGHDLVPMLEVPMPNAEFSELLKTHGLLSVWDSGMAYILCSLAVTKLTHFETTVNRSIHAQSIEEFSFLTQDRLDVHVPATKFPALIRIKLEKCLAAAKQIVQNTQSSV